MNNLENKINKQKLKSDDFNNARNIILDAMIEADIPEAEVIKACFNISDKLKNLCLNDNIIGNFEDNRDFLNNILNKLEEIDIKTDNLIDFINGKEKE